MCFERTRGSLISTQMWAHVSSSELSEAPFAPFNLTSLPFAKMSTEFANATILADDLVFAVSRPSVFIGVPRFSL